MRVEIGEQYSFQPNPNPEYRCPVCHVKVIDNDSTYLNFKGDIVTPLVDVAGQQVLHRTCGKVFPAPEGLYLVILKTGHHMAVPYTWLEPMNS